MRTPSAAASFAYTVAGHRTVVNLDPGQSFSLRLLESQRKTLTLEPLAGQVGLATSWDVPVDRNAVTRDPELKLSRTFTPFPDIPGDARVEVRLTATFGPQAVAGCHEISDLVPSGLAPIEHVVTLVRGGLVGIVVPLAVPDRRPACLVLRQPDHEIQDGQDALLRADRDGGHLCVGVGGHPVREWRPTAST